MLRRTLSFLGLIAFILAVRPAHATTITTYSDPASWSSASTVAQTITFEGLAPANGSTTYSGPTGLTTGGVEFIGYTYSGGSWIQVIDTNFSSWYNFGSNDALLQDMDRPSSGSPLPYIHIVLPANVTALGMDLFTVSPSAATYQITVAGTPYTVPTDPKPTEAFWGLTSDTPIATLDLTLPGSVYNGSTMALLDNFQYGTASSQVSQAPEAATFVLIGSGLIGIAALKRLARKPR
ncbi:MAG TPA: hypothetical protein VKX49_17595 [Bryobacteraceae bacterium]|nr:hypothetical protein [Bryobacteraceae bacterium]